MWVKGNLIGLLFIKKGKIYLLFGIRHNIEQIGRPDLYMRKKRKKRRLISRNKKAAFSVYISLRINLRIYKFSAAQSSPIPQLLPFNFQFFTLNSIFFDGFTLSSKSSPSEAAQRWFSDDNLIVLTIFCRRMGFYLFWGLC